MVEISFIIVNWNTRDILIDCLNSIYKTVKDIDSEIYVVDNNGIVRYRQIVPVQGQEPDYESALNAVRELME